MASLFLIGCLTTMAVLCDWGPATASRNRHERIRDAQCLMRPFVLTRNEGQWNSRVEFAADAGNARVWLTSGSMNIQVSNGRMEDDLASQEERRNTAAAISSSNEIFDPRPEAGLGLINLTFIGANPDPTVVGEHPTRFAYNYFRGTTPDDWHVNVTNYRSVLYRDAYDGIDVRYLCTNNGAMHIEFTVSPGADVSQIRIALESTEPEQADQRSRAAVLASRSDLIASARVSQMRGNRQAEDVGSIQYVAEGILGVQLDNGYDDKASLVISATLDFSTYLGGGSFDQAWDIAVDDSGYIYVTGSTTSSDFPMKHAIDSNHLGDIAVFVTKISPSGDSLIYSTFLQGNLTDHGRSIAVDRLQCAYVTGSTQNGTVDFPVWNAYQSTYNGSYDAFVTKLSRDGDSLIYSTLLGGNGANLGYGIAVDSLGRAVATGYTTSTDFPTPNGHQPVPGGSHDAYVVRLSASGSVLEFGTYLGGSGADDGWDVALDENENIYVTGLTESGNFPLRNAIDSVLGGSRDAFVTCLSPNDDSLIYSTYLGGSAGDEGFSIDADADGNTYVTGTTASSDFPTQDAYDTTLDGSEDAFVTKVATFGLSLAYSTYLGGADIDHGLGVAVDASGSAYITGGTTSADFSTENAYDEIHNGDEDAFITQFSPDGMSLMSSTYLGGSAFDRGNGIAVGADLYVYVAGETQSSDFPTQNAMDSSYNGGSDAFVVMFEPFNNPPIARCCDPIVTSADGDCVGWVTPNDVDCGSSDPDGDPITPSLDPPPPYELGITPVWLVVEDDKGAKDSCEASITVEDDSPPEVSCPEAITVPNDPGECGAIVTWDPPFAADNCEDVTAYCDPPLGSFFPVGTTQVTCIANDASGNADTCTFDVTVEDTELPVATCPNDITVQAPECETCAEVEIVTSVDDNCPGATISCDPPPGFCFPIGTTAVTCIATDATGNADTCTFNVTVEPYPCDTLWIEPANIYYGPDGCTVPVSLSNHTEIGGGTVPLTYEPLPPGWSCDSVSYVGSRLEDESYRNIIDSTIVDNVNRTVLLHWAGGVCLPEGQGPLFYIWLSNPTCGADFDKEPHPICIDTATVNGKWLRLADCGGNPLAAEFAPACADLHHYQMSDVIGGSGGGPDCLVDVLDVVCLVNMAFRSGDCDWAVPAGDNNCDSQINVLDVVAAVNRAFRGSSLQFCGCASQPGALPRATASTTVASLDRTGVTRDRWESTLMLSVPLPWAAAQLEWTFDGNAEDISVTVGNGAAGLEPYWHQDGNEMTVGLIDIYGETVIEPGQTTVLHLSGTGEFPGLRLASGLLATQDAEPIMISPAELAATDAVVRPSTFVLGDCYPNPFNAGTVIPYTLAENGQVRLEVFDVLGRRVASLVNEFQSTGQYDVAWNGLDDRGQPLASGMYFYRLTTADIAVTKKMVLLK
ncbi:MAG TPA: SBBP repeat-containing protein [Acidobacteriota bacterium]|nr:SBBP repeat-containing protein [Acidobacteriota bacterium]